MSARSPACPRCTAREALPTRNRWLRRLAVVWVRVYRCQECYARFWRVRPWWWAEPVPPPAEGSTRATPARET